LIREVIEADGNVVLASADETGTDIADCSRNMDIEVSLILLISLLIGKGILTDTFNSTVSEIDGSADIAVIEGIFGDDSYLGVAEDDIGIITPFECAFSDGVNLGVCEVYGIEFFAVSERFLSYSSYISSSHIECSD